MASRRRSNPWRPLLLVAVVLLGLNALTLVALHTVFVDPVFYVPETMVENPGAGR